MAENEQEYGEMYEVEEDSSVRDTDDGGAIITLDDSPTPGESEFYANLAETMPSWELANLGSSLCDIIEKDKEARKRRKKKKLENQVKLREMACQRAVLFCLKRKFYSL